MAKKGFEALLREGTRFLMAGDVQESLPLLLEAHERRPQHFQAALNLSGALILLKQFRRAVPLLEELSRQEPDNPTVWQNLGAAYLANPVLADEESQLRAIGAFKRAIAINPHAPNVAYNIALVYRDRGDGEQAAHWFAQALEADPDDEDARRNLQRLHEK